MLVSYVNVICDVHGTLTKAFVPPNKKHLKNRLIEKKHLLSSPNRLLKCPHAMFFLFSLFSPQNYEKVDIASCKTMILLAKKRIIFTFLTPEHIVLLSHSVEI